MSARKTQQVRRHPHPVGVRVRRRRRRGDGAVADLGHPVRRRQRRVAAARRCCGRRAGPGWYRRRPCLEKEELTISALPRDLHPAAWWIWALGLAAAASRTTNPLAARSCSSLVACVRSLARRTDAPWARAFRLYLLLGLVVVVMRVAFRVLFGGGYGQTRAAEPARDPAAGLGGGHHPARSGRPRRPLLGGLYDGLRLATIVICVGAANALANPQAAAARRCPRALYEVGTAVVVACRVFPQLAESVQRVRRARRLRGDPGKGVGALRTRRHPGARGRPGAVAGAGGGDGLPRLRTRRQVRPTGAPADRGRCWSAGCSGSASGSTRSSTRPRRGCWPGRCSLLGVGAALAARVRARRPAGPAHPVPARPLARAELLDGGHRCPGRCRDELAWPRAPTRTVADTRPRTVPPLSAGGTAARCWWRRPGLRSRRRPSSRLTVTPRRERAPAIAGASERSARDRAGATSRSPTTARPSRPCATSTSGRRGRAGAGRRPHRLRQVDAARHGQRAGAALHRWPPHGTSCVDGRDTRDTTAARARRPGRLRRPGPARRLRHRHRRGGARLRHGAARARAADDARAGRGDPRPARHRRPAAPRRCATLSGGQQQRVAIGAVLTDAPAGAGARRADLRARPDRRRGGAGTLDPAGPRPRRHRGASPSTGWSGWCSTPTGCCASWRRPGAVRRPAGADAGASRRRAAGGRARPAGRLEPLPLSVRDARRRAGAAARPARGAPPPARARAGRRRAGAAAPSGVVVRYGARSPCATSTSTVHAGEVTR